MFRPFIIPFALISLGARAQGNGLVCNPIATDNRVVASAADRRSAGIRAHPPLIDERAGFAWPDSPLGAVRSGDRLIFFGSDGGRHNADGRKLAGSVVRTVGTLDAPLGYAEPVDVPIGRNRDPAVDPGYPTYSYLGGGPVYRVPAGLPGAGQLLMVTHAEITTPETQPKPGFYSLLGLAASSDQGLSWMDLGEIIRVHHPYAADMDGFEIGDPPLTLSPDGTFEIFFRDWLGGGAHTSHTVTTMSVARAPVAAVLQAAFGPHPHAAIFHKFFDGNWTEPGMGGQSSDLAPQGLPGDERQVLYDNALQRFVVILAGGPRIGYAESADGLHWTTATTLVDFRTRDHTIYAMPVGIDDDPNRLKRRFAILYTWYPTHGGGWNAADLRRLTVVCR